MNILFILKLLIVQEIGYYTNVILGIKFWFNRTIVISTSFYHISTFLHFVLDGNKLKFIHGRGILFLRTFSLLDKYSPLVFNSRPRPCFPFYGLRWSLRWATCPECPCPRRPIQRVGSAAQLEPPVHIPGSFVAPYHFTVLFKNTINIIATKKKLNLNLNLQLHNNIALLGFFGEVNCHR